MKGSSSHCIASSSINLKSDNCDLVKPTVIEMPRVRILNQNFDTPSRQFPVGTAIQLTCQGQVGSDKSKVRINAY